MPQESPIINVLTYGLPYELANQITSVRLN